MNPNISIYRQLNLKLLVQVKLSLSLLHWANMSNISLTIRNIHCNYPFLKLYMLEWMQKGKYKIRILRIQGLRGSALSAYIHRGIL